MGEFAYLDDSLSDEFNGEDDDVGVNDDDNCSGPRPLL